MDRRGRDPRLFLSVHQLLLQQKGVELRLKKCNSSFCVFHQLQPLKNQCQLCLQNLPATLLGPASLPAAWGLPELQAPQSPAFQFVWIS